MADRWISSYQHWLSQRRPLLHQYRRPSFTLELAYFGCYLARHRIGRDKLKRYGRFVIPFVLIAIGLNILRGRQGAA